METKKIDKVTKAGEIVTVIGIEVRKDNVTGKINKMTFVNASGLPITWKPKVDNEHYEEGLKVIVTDKMELTQVPALVKEMLNVITSVGNVTVKANYKVLKDINEVTKEPVEYHFITSQAELNTWSIVKKGGK